VIVKVYGI